MKPQSVDLDRRAFLATAGAGVLWLSGCSGGSSTTGGTSTSTGGDDLSGVIYEGGATDEALEALLASGSAPYDATNGTRFLEPAAGTAIDPATPMTFDWAVGAEMGASLGERILGTLLGEHDAFAHGAPVSGRAYFVVFSSSSSPKLVRVFTTLLSYTPTDDVWARVASAGGPVTVKIVNAIFDENRLSEGGGPFSGSDLSIGGAG